ncbi:uncharacterized protein LOC129906950 [Episyrphus balteatus]|uniref:uncharacterized protein LOC129906950 n=1 Tax=Episyrphus balteatus TaxID=286459 RepID=UPI0024856E61|nr:uncharacterized protein LOC129906950 [Episyrphus balteatus]
MASINIDLLKLLKKLPNFNGKPCSLIIFINKSEFIINARSLYNDAVKEFIVSEIKSKITDFALDVVSRSGDPNDWQEVKKILVRNSGEKESFLKLKEQVDKVYSRNITQLYNSYSDILCRLNNKYYLLELDWNWNGKFWRRNLKNSNPLVPKLYGLPKIHKPGEKMRPIVSNINSPTQKLSRWVHNELTKIGCIEGFRVNNREELIERTKNLRLNEGEILVSFDVTALFPSVPIPETIIILREWLTAKNVPAFKVDMLVEMTEICMNQNIFIFNGEFFKQDEGTAMGNNLSPFIADPLLWHFEEKIKNSRDFPRVWLRYVDDIFADSTLEQYPRTLNIINSQFGSVKFTVEVEIERKLPFLDLWLERSSNNSIKFNIYRKPTQTKRYITSDSFHCFSHKYAAMNAMIHRMLNTPLNEEDYNVEFNYIMDCAKVNGLNEKIIQNTTRKKIQQQFKEQNTTLLSEQLASELSVEKWAKMIYYPTITNKTSSVLRNNKIKLAYKSSRTIKNMLESTKQKTDPLDKSCIYKLECSGCNAVYIGQTSRSIKKRFRNHQLDIQNKTEKNSFR